jgi:hypothetical protein
VLDCIPTDTFILEIVYEHNGNVLLEYSVNSFNAHESTHDSTLFADSLYPKCPVNSVTATQYADISLSVKYFVTRAGCNRNFTKFFSSYGFLRLQKNFQD